MSALSRIGLGTAQFGSRYGISNRQGQPDEREVAAILERAVAAGIDLFDTATAYGDAERIIGRHLPRGRTPRIVSKVPPVAAAAVQAGDGRAWLEAVAASLDRLRVGKLHAVLVHRASDFAKLGWQHLADALAQARQRGLTEHIGASVYDADQLALIGSRFAPEIVQLPLNALDRRLIDSGMLARLKSAGTEIHARSIFLQGLLLMPPHDMPEFFAPVRGPIGSLQQGWRAQGLSALAGCLAFALRRPEIDAAIVGVNRLAELDEIIAAVAAAEHTAVDPGVPTNIDATYLDSSRWPRLAS